MKESILSAVILTRNSETVLVDCLESIDFCDEVIVVDNHSTDTTREIAKKHKATVVEGVDNNFAENRNIGLKKAKGKWIFYIDSDERVSNELQRTIQQAIATEEFAGYKIQRKNFYLGNNPWPKIETLERLFRKDHLEKWYGNLHETPKVNGVIGLLDGYLFHYTHRDLAGMLDKTIAWSQIEAKLRFETNHPRIVIWRLIRVMLTGFWDSYIRQKGFKAGTMGFIESIYQSYSMFITYATLWEMQKKKQ